MSESILDLLHCFILIPFPFIVNYSDNIKICYTFPLCLPVPSPANQAVPLTTIQVPCIHICMMCVFKCTPNNISLIYLYFGGGNRSQYILITLITP